MQLFKNDKIQKLTLLLASLLVAFILSEGILRLIEIRTLNQLSAEHHFDLYKQLFMVSPNPEVSFEHRPNVDIKFVSRQGTYYTMHVITNSEGLREEIGIPFRKPENEKRIIGLGDSIVFGASVDNTETFLRVMESVLSNEKFRVKTLNFGVGSSNPRLEYHYLNYKQGIEYQPDIILLGLAINDFNMKYVAFDPQFGNWYYPDEKKEAVDPRPIIKAASPKSRVVWLLTDVKNLIVARINHPSPQKPAGLVNQEDAERLKYWIGKIKEYSNIANAKFLIIIFPKKNQLEFALKSGDFNFPEQEAIIDICREINIPCYDLIPDLVPYLGSKNITIDQFYWDYLHPWKDGHFAIGQLVARWIQKNKWIEN